jgi:hypothetical protein
MLPFAGRGPCLIPLISGNHLRISPGSPSRLGTKQPLRVIQSSALGCTTRSTCEIPSSSPRSDIPAALTDDAHNSPMHKVTNICPEFSALHDAASPRGTPYIISLPWSDWPTTHSTSITRLWLPDAFIAVTRPRELNRNPATTLLSSWSLRSHLRRADPVGGPALTALSPRRCPDNSPAQSSRAIPSTISLGYIDELTVQLS